jgi:hypothetical protein
VKAQIQAGVIYLGLAAGIAILWLTGTGARGVQAIRDAAAGTPSARFSIRPYAPPGGARAGGGRRP